MQEIVIRTDKDSIQDTIESFINMVGEVPWGNSDWQNKQAIVNAELTPERAYRHASLRIMNRLQALNECYYNLRKEEVQIERHRRKMMTGDDLDKREAEIEIDLLESRKPYTMKLIKDAIAEIESLTPVIQSIGKLDRATFESAEAGHFEQKYHNQVTGKGDAHVGLEALGVDLQTGKHLPEHIPLYDAILADGKKMLEKH